MFLLLKFSFRSCNGNSRVNLSVLVTVLGKSTYYLEGTNWVRNVHKKQLFMARIHVKVCLCKLCGQHDKKKHQHDKQFSCLKMLICRIAYVQRWRQKYYAGGKLIILTFINIHRTKFSLWTNQCRTSVTRCVAYSILLDNPVLYIALTWNTL